MQRSTKLIFICIFKFIKYSLLTILLLVAFLLDYNEILL
jgi:hypothetical protein